MIDFGYPQLIGEIQKDFKIDFYGDHGIDHWQRVYLNSQKIAAHYQIASDVFALFALLHDSKRHDEYEDIHHGVRAAAFAKRLLREGRITLDEMDSKRLLYACANHTRSDESDPLFHDLVVQICFDSDRLDIGRVGYEIDSSYLATAYAKRLVEGGVVKLVKEESVRI